MFRKETGIVIGWVETTPTSAYISTDCFPKMFSPSTDSTYYKGVTNFLLQDSDSVTDLYTLGAAFHSLPLMLSNPYSELAFK